VLPDSVEVEGTAEVIVWVLVSGPLVLDVTVVLASSVVLDGADELEVSEVLVASLVGEVASPHSQKNLIL
jgi:hypothetical protein